MLPRRGSRRSSADTEPQFLCHEHEMPWMLLIPTSFSLTNWHLETWPLHCPVSLETESKAGRRMFLQAEAILQLSEFRWVKTILINIPWIKQTHKHTDSTPLPYRFTLACWQPHHTLSCFLPGYSWLLISYLQAFWFFCMSNFLTESVQPKSPSVGYAVTSGQLHSARKKKITPLHTL